MQTQFKYLSTTVTSDMDKLFRVIDTIYLSDWCVEGLHIKKFDQNDNNQRKNLSCWIIYKVTYRNYEFTLKGNFCANHFIYAYSEDKHRSMMSVEFKKGLFELLIPYNREIALELLDV